MASFIPLPSAPKPPLKPPSELPKVKGKTTELNFELPEHITHCDSQRVEIMRHYSFILVSKPTNFNKTRYNKSSRLILCSIRYLPSPEPPEPPAPLSLPAKSPPAEPERLLRDFKASGAMSKLTQDQFLFRSNPEKMSSNFIRDHLLNPFKPSGPSLPAALKTELKNSPALAQSSGVNSASPSILSRRKMHAELQKIWTKIQ